MVKALPIDVIWKKRVIRSKIVREGWMSDNGLNNVMELIEKTRNGKILFKKRLLVHVDAVKEFYAKMTVIHLKKKDVVKSSVKGICIEFDHERLAAILDVPGRTGICEYIKEVWEESRYTKPLEITRRFANDATIMKARRVRSVEMKPSQRFIHFHGNEKCDTSIWEERHLKLLGLDIYGSLNGKEDHELPYGDWLTLVFEAFGVPLVIKKGEEPKKYDFFEDTFLTMCKPTGEDGIWWIGSGENRRRDDDEATQEEEAEGDDEGNKDDFGREAIIDEATVEGESESDDQFYDAQVGEEEPVTETPAAPATRLHLRLDEKIKNLQESTPRVLQAEMLNF
ncbi:hypothetical protein Dimus_011161 [Dionaea muscipula]